METFDLIVLGGGRASNLAIQAAKEGWKTAIIERDRLGGTCPNRGCVPSKLLIGFADAARHVRDAEKHFVDAEFRGVDLQRIFESVNGYISGVDGRYEERAKKAGVTIIRGEGRFIGNKQISVGDRILTADKIVIATGARPKPSPYPDLPVWTSDDLFPLSEAPPKSLLIIGGGVIGCETASLFSALGVKTTIFVRKGNVLGKEDSEIEEVFREEFGKRVETRVHAELKDLTYDGQGFKAVFSVDGNTEVHEAERVLFAIGRIPNSDMLSLDKTGVELDDKGFITVDEHLRTNIEGIYAAGDVNGRYMLQHAAAREVHYLRQKFLKKDEGPIDEGPLGHAIFAHPEVAAVGETEEQLQKTGNAYVKVVSDWEASARVTAMRIDYPRTKLLVSPEDYSILGCHLVGPEASTLIHQVITVMKLKNDVRELADTIFVHPALNECLLDAAVQAIRKVRAHKSK